MSATVKEFWDMILKSLAIVALGLFVWIANNALDKLDRTYEGQIRQEEKLISIDLRLKRIEDNVK